MSLCTLGYGPVHKQKAPSCSVADGEVPTHSPPGPHSGKSLLPSGRKPHIQGHDFPCLRGPGGIKVQGKTTHTVCSRTCWPQPGFVGAESHGTSGPQSCSALPCTDAHPQSPCCPPHSIFTCMSGGHNHSAAAEVAGGWRQLYGEQVGPHSCYFFTVFVAMERLLPEHLQA